MLYLSKVKGPMPCSDSSSFVCALALKSPPKIAGPLAEALLKSGV